MFILGVNYWPRKSSLEMLRKGSLEEVAKDLAVIRELGFNAVRLFLLLRDVVDPDEGILSDRLELFAKIVEKGGELGLAMYPTLVTIHMSGHNWANPLLEGKLFSLETLDNLQVFIARIVSELREHASIKGWILTNEISLVEKPPNPKAYRAFARSLILTVKGVDHERPVGLGDIVFFVPGTDPESMDTIPADFVDLHIYYYDNDDVRQGLAYSALASLYSASGKPVVIEEFGCSTHVFDEESHARFANALLHSLLANGVSGAFIWCFADYVQEAEHLFEYHPYELGFGIVRKDGSLKPVAQVIKQFSELLKELESEGLGDEYSLRKREVAIVATRHCWSAVPFVSRGSDVATLSCLECYTLFKGVSAPVTMLPEHLVGKSSYKLYALPSIVIASVSTWRSLLAKAVEGSVVYASILRIPSEAHKGPCHVWEELFGVKPKLKACRVGRPVEGLVTIEFVKDFGPLAKGARLRIKVGSRVSERIFCWEADAEKAEVLAVFSDGSPAIFLHSVGKGYAVLSVVPIEALLASQDAVDRASSDVRVVYGFFDALAELAGVERLFVSSDPRVEVEYYVGKKGAMVFAVNHSHEDLEVEVRARDRKVKNVDKVGGDASVKEVGDDAVRLSMPGRSVAVLKVRLG